MYKQVLLLCPYSSELAFVMNYCISILSFFFFLVCVAFWCNGLFLEAVLLQKFSVQSVFTDALYTAFDSKYKAFYFIGFSGTHACSP